LVVLGAAYVLCVFLKNFEFGRFPFQKLLRLYALLSARRHDFPFEPVNIVLSRLSLHLQFSLVQGIRI
jgi:hypothetical protein